MTRLENTIIPTRGEKSYLVLHIRRHTQEMFFFQKDHSCLFYYCQNEFLPPWSDKMEGAQLPVHIKMNAKKEPEQFTFRIFCIVS